MDKAMYLLIGIVSVVLITGIITLLPAGTFSSLASITGNVVAEQQRALPHLDCNTCTGTPVCAINPEHPTTVRDYANECEALCDNARVVYHNYCGAIPIAKTK